MKIGLHSNKINIKLFYTVNQSNDMFHQITLKFKKYFNNLIVYIFLLNNNVILLFYIVTLIYEINYYALSV